MAKQYTEDDLGILVAGDWSLLNSEGAEVMHGAGVRATQRQKPGPWNYPREMVLTFPFSLNQFRDFCDWHTYFQWEVIEAQYLNDDGSLDEDALGELAQRGEDAAELVRRYLTGETDAEKAAGPPPTVDRAEAREAPPTGQQDAPERSSSEEDSGESRAGEVHPDALAKAIATEVVQQLRNPTDVPAAPDGTQQDAPGGNKVWTDKKKEELSAYREKHGTKMAAEHFNISPARVRQLLPSKKPKATPFSGLVKRE